MSSGREQPGNEAMMRRCDVSAIDFCIYNNMRTGAIYGCCRGRSARRHAGTRAAPRGPRPARRRAAGPGARRGGQRNGPTASPIDCAHSDPAACSTTLRTLAYSGAHGTAPWAGLDPRARLDRSDLAAHRACAARKIAQHSSRYLYSLRPRVTVAAAPTEPDPTTHDREMNPHCCADALPAPSIHEAQACCEWQAPLSRGTLGRREHPSQRRR